MQVCLDGNARDLTFRVVFSVAQKFSHFYFKFSHNPKICSMKPFSSLAFKNFLKQQNPFTIL